MAQRRLRSDRVSYCRACIQGCRSDWSIEVPEGASIDNCDNVITITQDMHGLCLYVAFQVSCSAPALPSDKAWTEFKWMQKASGVRLMSFSEPPTAQPEDDLTLSASLHVPRSSWTTSKRTSKKEKCASAGGASHVMHASWRTSYSEARRSLETFFLHRADD